MKNQLKIFVKYNKNKPAIHSTNFYQNRVGIYIIQQNRFGKLILANHLFFSTNKGLKSILECKKL
jgi:hypothetical protein